MRQLKMTYQNIYLLLYGLYTYFVIINQSLIELPYVILFSVMMASIIILLLLHASLQIRSTNLKRLIISLSIIVLFIAASITNNNLTILVYSVFILTSYNVTFDKIVKTAIYSKGIALITILFSILIGQTSDLIYRNGPRIAHCLGFSYYSQFSYYVFFITIEVAYLYRDRIKTSHILIILLLNFIAYLYSTVRLTLILTFVFAGLLYFYCVRDFNLHINNKVKLFFASIAFPSGMIIILLCMIFYDESVIQWRSLNLLLNGRLQMMRRGFIDYPPTLFGQYIYMEGNRLTRLVRTINFYIDSGYAYSLLAYGILFTIFILILYSLLFRDACKRRDKVLCIWLFTLFVFSFVNDVTIRITTTPILLCVSSTTLIPANTRYSNGGLLRNTLDLRRGQYG